ncbi:MAG TPA: hypothetical protein VHS59_03340 [Bacillota bacterium]|nr:hypothetical protein [Bacillota bacterium]
MKTKIFLLLFAGACTVLSLVITQNYVKDKLKETQVVVFRQDIQPFTQLTEEMLEIKQVGVNGLHAQASASIDEVKGLFLDSKAVKGEVALKSKLYRKEQLAKGYLFQMKPDERVIAVTTDLSRSAGGTVCSGDYVDLIAVVDEKKRHGTNC